MMYAGLLIGCPLSYVTGLLVAWVLRLARPWAVSLLGLQSTGALFLIVGCAYARFAQMGDGPSPPWLSLVLILAPYALVALIPLGEHQPSVTATDVTHP
jgi:hypothetical protein